MDLIINIMLIEFFYSDNYKSFAHYINYINISFTTSLAKSHVIL
jgi:hypothetical protein